MEPLSSRITDAFDYARVAHGHQLRKGSNIPYLYHLLGVASLVLEFGGTEDQAIAGLLHDVVEDCGEHHSAVLRAKFSDSVADIVDDCTDGTAESKGTFTTADEKRVDWQQRKERYLSHLEQVGSSTLLVSACDKLHNARAIVQDMESDGVGTMVFDRFTGGRDGTLWYYRSLAIIFSTRDTAPSGVLLETVIRMHALAGDDWAQSIEAGSLRSLPDPAALETYRQGQPSEPATSRSQFSFSNRR